MIIYKLLLFYFSLFYNFFLSLKSLFLCSLHLFCSANHLSSAIDDLTIIIIMINDLTILSLSLLSYEFCGYPVGQISWEDEDRYCDYLVSSSWPWQRWWWWWVLMKLTSTIICCSEELRGSGCFHWLIVAVFTDQPEWSLMILLFSLRLLFFQTDCSCFGRKIIAIVIAGVW